MFIVKLKIQTRDEASFRNAMRLIDSLSDDLVKFKKLPKDITDTLDSIAKAMDHVSFDTSIVGP